MAQHRMFHCKKTERTHMKTSNNSPKKKALPKRVSKQINIRTTLKRIIAGSVLIAGLSSLANAGTTEWWCSNWKKNQPKRDCITIYLEAKRDDEASPWVMASYYKKNPKINDDELPLSSIEVRVGKRGDNQRSHRFTATIHLVRQLEWDALSDTTSYEGRKVSSVNRATSASNSQTDWMNANFNDAVGLVSSDHNTRLPLPNDFDTADVAEYSFKAVRNSGTGGYVDIRWTFQ
jgi:hypothetical protein